MQKRSFCTAIPIVLVGKGSRFAVQIDRFCAAKPIVLGLQRLILPKNNCVFVVGKHEKTAVRGLKFSRMNFLVEEQYLQNSKLIIIL